MAETADILVIGAGVFGLWAARAAAARGLSVIVADRSHAGAGASGGVVGALTPHAPTRWTAFKAFQRDALVRLPEAIARLEAETGLATGYVRTGRLTPLPDTAARARAEATADGAVSHWRGVGAIELLDRAPPALAALVADDTAAAGWMRDTLSALIDPRALVAALAAPLHGAGRLRESWQATALDPTRAIARFNQGEIAAGAIILAAGWQTLDLVQGSAWQGVGMTGVKGQAALLDATLPVDCPVLQAPGLYVVPHGPGRIAVGSTSERDWTQTAPDSALDAVIAKARRIVPALGSAPVVERWSGIRPRAPGPEPLIDRLPGGGDVVVATGGYKIGIGIAQRAGEAAAALAAGEPPPFALPPGFSATAHGLDGTAARISPQRPDAHG